MFGDLPEGVWWWEEASKEESDAFHQWRKNAFLKKRLAERQEDSATPAKQCIARGLGAFVFVAEASRWSHCAQCAGLCWVTSRLKRTENEQHAGAECSPILWSRAALLLRPLVCSRRPNISEVSCDQGGMSQLRVQRPRAKVLFCRRYAAGVAKARG